MGSALGILVVLMAAAFAVPADGDEVQPFPTKTSTFKDNDLTFVVDGRVEIPSRAKVVSVRRSKIVGGESGGVIEVSGTLELKAVTGGNVVLENVWIEVTPECKSLYLSACRFVGDSGIRPSDKGPSEARIYIEAARFDPGTSLTLATCSGKVTFSGVYARGPISILGQLRGEKGSNQTELQVVSTTAHGGFAVENVADVIVTKSMLGGQETKLADCSELTFTALHVRSPDVVFSQSQPKSFGRTSIKSTDFLSERITFAAPAFKEGDAERVEFDFCWFGGRTDPDSIREAMITDIGKDPSVAVLATFKKIQAEQLNMVRYRPPQD